MKKHKMNEITDIIHDKVKSHKEIQKLLYYDESDVDIYNMPDLSRSQAKQVMNNNIFTKKQAFSKDEKAKCYLCMQYGTRRYHGKRNSYFDGNTFNFYVLCRNDIAINDYVGSRINEVEGILEEIFDDGEIGTVCRSRMISSEDFDAKDDYYGRHIIIEFYDFNGDKYGY